MKALKEKFRPLSVWVSGHHQLSIAIVLSVATLCLLMAFSFVFHSGARLLSEKTYQHAVELQQEQLHISTHNFILLIDLIRQEIKEEHPDWSPEQIDVRVKQIAYQRVHQLEFRNNAFISIKQVRDYNGGSRYAVLFANPRNPEHEGTSLSTELTDSNQKHYFLEQLEGIRQAGKIAQVHSCPEPESGKILERLSYSEAYPDYDWIVTMSIDADTLQQYPQKNESQIVPQLRLYMVLFFLSILAMVLLTVFFILHSDKEYFGTQKKELQQQINWDTLTSAHSRKYGAELLRREWENYQHRLTANDTAVMMLDIDHFKEFNDQYGHDIGDAVLREVVLAIRRASRSSDSIIRWGGDEFVGIFYGLKRTHTELMIEKILHAINDIHISIGSTEIKVTVSMGFAFFQSGDSDEQVVLKRADEALYEAKKAGRNQGKTVD